MFKCIFCDHNESEVVVNKENIRFECYGFDKKVVKCCFCELVQLYPQWTGEELNLLYSKYSHKKDFNGQKKKSVCEKRLLKCISNSISLNDKVLEIGCGDGKYIKYFQSQGKDFLGIDKDASISSPNVLNIDFKQYTTDKKYDFIYALHLFEHVNFKELIPKLVSLLKPNGKFLLEIPSLADPLVKLYKNKEYNKFYWYPYHLFYYDENTIKKIFCKYDIDIEVKKVNRYGTINHMRWWLLKRPGNFNAKIPVLDNIYSIALIKIFDAYDTLQITNKSTR